MGQCEGCIETDGRCLKWSDSQGCPIAMCSYGKELPFCGVCAEFPCEKFLTTVTWNKNAITTVSELAVKYKKWLKDLINLIQDADELYSTNSISDCEKRDFGLLFYAEENPTKHDANHAVITNLEDIDNTLEQIKEFYLAKHLTPRIYLREGQYEKIKEKLIAHGYILENIGNFQHFLLTRKNRIPSTHKLIVKIAASTDLIDDKLLDNISEEYTVSDPDERERLKLSLLRLINNNDKVYIGYDNNNEPVTMAVLCKTTDDLYYLDLVETGKRFQGNGYCRELISKIISDCNNTIFLSSENPTAIRIYKEAGFTPIKIRSNDLYWRAYYASKK